eukprot:TRINITY_DN782306_c0_g1_i1.p1 TRINITY_DN782306_c0_g1~~TRINITY_DN782306_c0_g1_i1.p1  ORF type:complete len:118 (-),score=34.95 TRINITY_DN782306_c0_g1_i1:287-640(-)
MDNSGIAKLKETQAEAAKLVLEARQERKAKLKQAKVDAGKTINSERSKREEKYQQLLQEKLGDSNVLAETMKSVTDEQISSIRADYDKNEEACLNLMLELVQRVKATIPEARKTQSQ